MYVIIEREEENYQSVPGFKNAQLTINLFLLKDFSNDCTEMTGALILKFVRYVTLH